ncbi:murein biosynthesis integral membrane protein MurJ [Candidatus Blastococcus massiliensis]|uniref:murein biosynthesis integral membrane protein MurJ n=1 Tax=Candidatus Blastococcus massiliensis TaxID=1470358 RepID=UPI0004BBD864|nr:lipid II flippase MurJ [Candidatus Blastococcus massiliensis]
MATDSVVGSAWIMVSRATGLVRIVAVAAVLGPTQFADLYQAANTVPNLLFELLVGALFASLLVPAVVRHVDAGDPVAAARLASRFLTLAVGTAVVLTLAVVLAGPWVVGLLRAGIPEGERAVPGGSAWLLLALLLVQVPLYMVVGVAAAVQQASGRFALAAGAPSVENVAITVVLGAYTVLFGTGRAGEHGTAEILLLGGGTTAAVLAHAAVQWAGARRCGVRLALARGGRRDPEVRGIVRLAVPSVGHAGLTAARYFCLLVVAAAVPGGVVAFTVAWAFYMLPSAVTARPIAQASLPHLSRAHAAGDEAGYREGFDRGLGLVLFLAVPAAVLYAVLSGPLATVVAFGEMATPAGRELLQHCMLGISLGIVGQAAFDVATPAAYARGDAGRPLRAVALRAVLAVAGMLGSLALLDGPALLLGVGLSIAVSDLVAAAFLCWAITHPLARGTSSAVPTLLRTTGAGLAMLPVVLGVRALAGEVSGRGEGLLVILLAGGAGALVYGGVQWALRSPELAGMLALLRGRGAVAGRGHG